MYNNNIKLITMKSINIILSVFLCIATVSCNEDEFLDQKPQGSLNDAVLNSADGVYYLVNSAYSALAGPNTTFGAMNAPVNHWIQGELHADNAYKGGGGPSDNTNMHKIETYVVDATHSMMNSWWVALYGSVKRTNSALKVLNTCTPEDVPDLEVLKAEMRVLRAHYYFELSRHFNKIVWIDENVEEIDYSSIRNDVYTRDEILGMIAQEFEEAAVILPETQSEVGRANKYVAEAYAAKVYLYKAYRQDPANNALTSIDNSDLEKVISYTGDVISSGKYGLLDDFQKLDMIAYENAEESIWAVQYSMNDGAVLSGFLSSSAGHVNFSQLLNTPKGPYSGDDFFKSSQDLVNAFKTDANGLPLLDGSFQNEDYDVVNEQINGDGTKSYINTQIESNVDPRLDFIIGRINVRWKTYEVEPVTEHWYRDFNAYGYHFVKRFLVSPEAGMYDGGWPWGASALNYQIIRYANVLLWRAEALIELGRQDEARPLINQIRLRSKTSPYVTAWDDTENFPTAIDIDGYPAIYLINEYPEAGWTQDYARQALRFETRIEIALEGERFFDLVRWGIAAETMNKYFRCEEDTRLYYKNVNFTAGRDEYYPIPLTQYNLTKDVYVQNPGYAEF
jgi:hypothetical protein